MWRSETDMIRFLRRPFLATRTPKVYKGEPMRSPTSHFDQPIPLSKIRAYYHARNAVLDGIPPDKFLLWRLRSYEAKYRRSQYPLLKDIVIEDGEVKAIANSASDAFWQQARDDPTGEVMGVPILTELERAEIARKLEEIEAEIARVNIEWHEVSDQVEALDAEKEDAIRRGEVLGSTTEGRSTGERRRPRLPVPWIPAFGYTAIVSMTVFEAYQLVPPFYDWLGVDSTNLAREWVRNPLGVASGAGFALSASFGLCLLWYLELRNASSIAKTWDSAGPVLTALRTTGLFGLGCFLLVGTYLLATMRHGMFHFIDLFHAAQQGQPTGADIGQSVFFFLMILVPFAAAYIHHRIGQSAYWLRRRESILKQEQWNRQNEERVLAAKRLADRRALRQQKQVQLERKRALLQNQLQILAQRAQAAQRQQVARLEQAQKATEVYARSLCAALQQDFYYFLRLAKRHKAEHLVPEQVRRHTNDPSQSPLPFVHALPPAGNNGHGD
jgi:hypothetical protein